MCVDVIVSLRELNERNNSSWLCPISTFAMYSTRRQFVTYDCWERFKRDFLRLTWLLTTMATTSTIVVVIYRSVCYSLFDFDWIRRVSSIWSARTTIDTYRTCTGKSITNSKELNLLLTTNENKKSRRIFMSSWFDLFIVIVAGFDNDWD
jgi:hypothetical protein